MQKTLLLSISIFLLAACSPMDQYKGQPGAFKQAQMLTNYEEGVNLTQEKRFEEAIPHFTKAIELDPNFVEAYIARGNARTELRMPTEALADFNKALQLEPGLRENSDYLYVFRDMSVCHTALKQWEEVIKDSNTMIHIYGKYPWAYMTRSMAYAALGRFEESKADDKLYEKYKAEFEKKSAK